MRVDISHERIYRSQSGTCYISHPRTINKIFTMKFNTFENLYLCPAGKIDKIASRERTQTEY